MSFICVFMMIYVDVQLQRSRKCYCYCQGFLHSPMQYFLPFVCGSYSQRISCRNPLEIIQEEGKVMSCVIMVCFIVPEQQKDCQVYCVHVYLTIVVMLILFHRFIHVNLKKYGYLYYFCLHDPHRLKLFEKQVLIPSS